MDRLFTIKKEFKKLNKKNLRKVKILIHYINTLWDSKDGYEEYIIQLFIFKHISMNIIIDIIGIL